MRHPFNKEKVLIKYYEQVNLRPLSELDAEPDLVLKEGCEIAEALGYEPLLASGTLLGIVRDKKLIPHDTDLDVNILVDKESRVLTVDGFKEFIKVYNLKGFRVIRVMLYHGTLMQVVFKKGAVIFDVEFIHKDLLFDWYTTVHEHGYYRYDKKFYEDLGTTTFKGVQYKTPHPVKMYLAHRYGLGWKKPTKEKGKWEEQAGNLVLWK